jgi:hypothetical protein
MGRAGNRCPAAVGGPEHSGGDHTPGRLLSATGDPLACGLRQGLRAGMFVCLSKRIKSLFDSSAKSLPMQWCCPRVVLR